LPGVELRNGFQEKGNEKRGTINRRRKAKGLGFHRLRGSKPEWEPFHPKREWSMKWEKVLAVIKSGREGQGDGKEEERKRLAFSGVEMRKVKCPGDQRNNNNRGNRDRISKDVAVH